MKDLDTWLATQHRDTKLTILTITQEVYNIDKPDTALMMSIHRYLVGLKYKVKSTEHGLVYTSPFRRRGKFHPLKYVTEYTIHGKHNITINLTDVQKDTWAIRRSGECLNRAGEWEYEPMPSSRDDDFLQRCRYTRQEALAYLEKNT